MKLHPTIHLGGHPILHRKQHRNYTTSSDTNIYGDLQRLLERDPSALVECCQIDIAYSASEAETYGNEEGRSLAERQSARLQAALGGTAYPDDQDDPAALLRNALCDLRHFADQHGLAFAEADKASHGIYRAEVQS